MYEMQLLINELIDSYPDLSLSGQDKNEITVSGIIHVNRYIDNFTVFKDWPVEIHIPTISGSLPYVIDIKNTINSNYPHRYEDGKLCLATDFDQKISFEESPSISKWIEKFVEPYLVVHEYYQRYADFPYKDREHGTKGILQSYQDFFNADASYSFNLLSHISQHIYRGHISCPCESGYKLRNCHGNKLRQIYNSPILLEQAKLDYQLIRKDYLKCISQQAKKF